MGRYFALALQMPASGVKNKKVVAKSTAMPKVNWGYLILALIVIFGLLYIFQVSSLSTRGYEIRKLEKEAAQLRDQIKRLQLEAADQKSIQNIEAGVKSLNMVPSGKMEFMRNGSGLSYKL